MARSGHAAGSEQGTQGKGGDAELIISGVLTRWTQVSTVLIEYLSCFIQLCMQQIYLMLRGWLSSDTTAVVWKGSAEEPGWLTLR